ncbi:MAG TPA: undecaprenyl-diphosphate phosphatase [Thermoanaerobaculia bacterium]|nr:undecaprenyl-diphosphate phosphatase [Thermoanaerobaculia bacterium]
MTPFQAAVLAIVQGVTEFLPISSSGHLILIPYFLRWEDQGLSFDIATHTGTLLAIIAYFHRDVRDLILGFFDGRPLSQSGDFAPRPMAWLIGLATIPAGLAGLLFKDWIAGEARNPLLIAGTAIGYGLLLGLADRAGRRDREIGTIDWKAALIIGAAQALALVPGTSRSGITITAALLLGFTRPAAARFSFLMIIPISVLVAVMDAVDLARAGVTAAELVPMGVGLVVSAVVGYMVIAWLLAWLRRQSLTVFVVYRILLGLVILATVWFRGGL